MSSKNAKYKNRWSLFEIIVLGISFIFTKLFYPGAKLICYPVYMRGKKSMQYGDGLNIGYACRFDLLNIEKVTLQIGKNCEMGDCCHIVAIDSVKIGDNFLAASKVFISDCSHGNYSSGKDRCSKPNEKPRQRTLESHPVTIGDNVWLGDNVVILPGVTIGNGCVIGANSVVNCNIEDNSIAVGVPAKIVKRYDLKNACWIRVE